MNSLERNDAWIACLVILGFLVAGGNAVRAEISISIGAEAEEAETTEEEVVIVDGVEQSSVSNVSFGDWLGYNSSQSDNVWIAGDDFGILSFQSFPTLTLGNDSALVFGSAFHFLDGPVVPDMPPRLFDFQMAYHFRKDLASSTFLDVKLGVGAFSDFERSARKGVRYPGHAVAYREWDADTVSVLGVEVLDRDDITLLPVAGWVFRPHEDFVIEAIFPRPKLQLRVGTNRAFYMSGELGGGTWAIERVDRSVDNVTYHDLRVVCGMVDFSEKSSSAWEFGWAFDRSLEYRSGAGDTNLDSALILRCNRHF